MSARGDVWCAVSGLHLCLVDNRVGKGGLKRHCRGAIYLSLLQVAVSALLRSCIKCCVSDEVALVLLSDTISGFASVKWCTFGEFACRRLFAPL